MFKRIISSYRFYLHEWLLLTVLHSKLLLSVDRSSCDNITTTVTSSTSVAPFGNKTTTPENSEKHQVPVFKDDFFSRVCCGYLFVDKTVMIKKYLQHNKSTVLLIRRPRKWGKSANLDMIKRFLQIQLDDDGKPLHELECVNKKLFIGGRIRIGKHNKTYKINPTRISRAGYTMSLQGTFPVLYLDFAADTGFMSSYENIKTHLRNKVNRLYDDHKYLQRYVSNTLLSQEETKTLRRYISKDYSSYELKQTLRFLSKLLYKHHRKKVHVLIDNVDVPVTQLYFNLTEKRRKRTNSSAVADVPSEVFDCDDFQRTLDLLRNMLEYCLNDNEAVDKAMITGILRLTEADIFVGIANMTDYTVLDEEFSEYYGFTQDEVDDMLYGMSFLNTRDEIRQWYSGYRRPGEHNEESANTLYNPWSVIQCLEYDGRLSNYWLNHCHMGIVEYALTDAEVAIKLKELADGRFINATVSKSITLNNDGILEDVYNILLFTGYLTADNIIPQGDGTYTCRLRIPNKEVKNMYMEKVKNVG